MRRNLAILIFGLLLISYGQFIMPAMVQEEGCMEAYTSVEECSEGAIIEGQVENEDRDPVRAGGFIFAVAGGFLLIGD